MRLALWSEDDGKASMLDQVRKAFFVIFLILSSCVTKNHMGTQGVGKQRNAILDLASAWDWPINSKVQVPMTSVVKGQNYLLVDFMNTQPRLDFYAVKVCTTRNDRCFQYDVSSDQNAILLPEKGTYSIVVRACYTDHTCSIVQDIRPFTVLMGSATHVKLASEVSGLREQLREIGDRITQNLFTMQAKYAQGDDAAKLEATNQLLSLSPDQRLQLYSKIGFQKYNQGLRDPEHRSMDYATAILIAVSVVSGVMAAGATGYAAYLSYGRINQVPELISGSMQEGKSGVEIDPTIIPPEPIVKYDENGGIGAGPKVMAISDDISRFGRLLSEQPDFQRLIFMEASQQESAGDEFSENFRNALRNHDVSKGMPILAMAVNIDDWHWVSVIVDLADKAPIVEFWDPLGSDISNYPLVDHIHQQIVKALQDLESTYEEFSIEEYVKEPVLTEEIIQQEVLRMLGDQKDEYILKWDETKGLKLMMARKESEGAEPKFAAVEIRPVFEDSQEMKNKKFRNGKPKWAFKLPFARRVPRGENKYAELTTRLQEQGYKLSLTQMIKENGKHLRQVDLYNCGVASAWFAEQRTKKSALELLQGPKPDYQQFREQMLARLHNSEFANFYPASYEVLDQSLHEEAIAKWRKEQEKIALNLKSSA